MIYSSSAICNHPYLVACHSVRTSQNSSKNIDFKGKVPGFCFKKNMTDEGSDQDRNKRKTDNVAKMASEEGLIHEII